MILGTSSIWLSSTNPRLMTAARLTSSLMSAEAYYSNFFKAYLLAVPIYAIPTVNMPARRNRGSFTSHSLWIKGSAICSLLNISIASDSPIDFIIFSWPVSYAYCNISSATLLFADPAMINPKINIKINIIIII